MNRHLKHLGILMIGPVLLSLVYQTNAQPSQNTNNTDSLRVAQKTMRPKNMRVHHPIFQTIEVADSIQAGVRNALLTPQDKKHIIIRDLLLRPQDRNAIMVHPVQDTLAQPDSTKQEK
jgi:hypothetical protein